MCRVAGAMLCAAVLTSGGDVAAQEGVVRHEYAIKAGVIKVLGKCVTWPTPAAPSRDEPLTIGILGKDPFFENGVNQLDRAIAEENLKGGNIVVKRFSSAKDYEPCHILFVSSLAADEGVEMTVDERIKAAAEITNGSTVLIVGESAGLAVQGAIANLLFDRATNLVRLEINPDAAARAGLKLSPDLLRLKLVMIVRDSPVRR
ncbi:MAG: YfiR family protein [Pirellulales bacterium]